jgi:hypothetical protein
MEALEQRLAALLLLVRRSGQRFEALIERVVA